MTPEEEIEELKESIEIATKEIGVFKLNIETLKVYRSEKLSRLQELKAQLPDPVSEEPVLCSDCIHAKGTCPISDGLKNVHRWNDGLKNVHSWAPLKVECTDFKPREEGGG